jgi:hypothetical protein
MSFFARLLGKRTDAYEQAVSGARVVTWRTAAIVFSSDLLGGYCSGAVVEGLLYMIPSSAGRRMGAGRLRAAVTPS